ncbi:MAG: discoidin domain-containing protein [Deltaproteobacteria bacterium]|nr:discoidin domain-containing protein [Deltaproteobacteria bacterium]
MGEALSFIAGRKDRVHLAVFIIIMLAGASLRYYVIKADLGVTIDSDEAVIGLMGKHILEGREFPAYFYGQGYMGSLEAFLAAGAFAIFGVSVSSLKLLMLALSMVFVSVTYFLARSMEDEVTALFSTLLVSIPPPFLTVYCLKARGGYIETLIFGSVLMLLSLKIRDSSRSAVPDLKFAALGFIAGLAWWTNNLVIYYFVPVSLILFKVLRKDNLPRLAAMTGLSFLIGSLPMWLYMIAHSSEKGGLVSFKRALPALKNFFLQGIPVILGARQAWSETDFFPSATLLLSVIYGGCLLYYVLKKRGSGGMTPVTFLLSVPVLFALSVKAGGFAIEPRYLLPIYSVLTFIVAWPIVKFSDYSRFAGATVAAVLVAVNLYGTFNLKPELQLPFSNGLRVERENGGLIELLEKEGIDAAYADYWIAYRLTFETVEDVLAIPWGETATNRYPGYLEMIKDRGRHAYILQGPPSERFESILKDNSIRFTKEEAGNYRVFYDLTVVDIGKDAVSAAGWRCSTGTDLENCEKAFDRDSGSGWNPRISTNGADYILDTGAVSEISFLKVDFGSLFGMIDKYPGATIKLFLSNDGLAWTGIQPSTHLDVNGDGNSFIFALNRAKARYIRITQDGRGAINFHQLYEIFIY